MAASDARSTRQRCGTLVVVLYLSLWLAIFRVTGQCMSCLSHAQTHTHTHRRLCVVDTTTTEPFQMDANAHVPSPSHGGIPPLGHGAGTSVRTRINAC